MTNYIFNIVTLLGGLALFLGGTAWSIQASEKRFMELDLNL